MHHSWSTNLVIWKHGEYYASSWERGNDLNDTVKASSVAETTLENLSPKAWPAKVSANKSLGRFKQVFTNKQELNLIGLALALDDRLLTFTPMDPKRLAYQLAERKKYPTKSVMILAWQEKVGFRASWSKFWSFISERLRRSHRPRLEQDVCWLVLCSIHFNGGLRWKWSHAW